MQVAANSAADEKVGELIADAMEKVGKDGVITVEESKTMDTNLSIRRRKNRNFVGRRRIK